jgi:hypothetical protein
MRCPHGPHPYAGTTVAKCNFISLYTSSKMCVFDYFIFKLKLWSSYEFVLKCESIEYEIIFFAFCDEANRVFFTYNMCFLYSGSLYLDRNFLFHSIIQELFNCDLALIQPLVTQEAWLHPTLFTVERLLKSKVGFYRFRHYTCIGILVQILFKVMTQGPYKLLQTFRALRYVK